MAMGLRHHTRLQYYYVLPLFVLILACFFAFSSSINTIMDNESLSNSESLISSGNRFKLSFFSLQNSSRFYLGIMYNLPVMTVVWVASREKPLNDSSGTFQISSDGNLVILDGRKRIVWSTNLPPSGEKRSAVLLYTGNLILRDDSNNGYVWQSFQHASDSWLEKMVILTDLSKNEKNMLTSWTSPDDPAPGRFTFSIEPSSGIPQLFVKKDGNPYARSCPIDRSGPTRLDDPRTTVGGDSPRIGNITFTVSKSSFLQYYVLNSSGNVELKVWSHDEKKKWEVTSQVGDKECDMYGKCGPFASCSADEMPMCTCFPSFIPKSDHEWEEGSWTNGCTRQTPLRCEHNSASTKQDGFLMLKNVKLPDNYMWFPAYKDCRVHA